jgi:hypothetical protein
MTRGVSAVRSPLDVLGEVTPEEVQAALDATRAFRGARPAPVNR